ncbi:DUF3298 and DUF4163 domain-containing protein [Alkaliphilus peptidifermentans]|nr:DUF3298 and DUF4163 domain-containing protein [Alkaliphilus peptidifermentans]
MSAEFKKPVSVHTLHYVTPNISFYYPMVYGLSDLIIQQKINYKITSLMLQVVSEVINPYSTTYVTGFYEIKTNERNVLSITLSALGDFGGAHPFTVVRSVSFDVKTGDYYKLYQLFKPNSHYIEKLSEMVYKQIKEREIPLLGEFKGVRMDQDYYIADKTLIIYFQLYEISPYYVGLPYFSIPIYNISDIIIKDSILDRMLYYL